MIPLVAVVFAKQVNASPESNISSDGGKLSSDNGETWNLMLLHPNLQITWSVMSNFWLLDGDMIPV